MANIIKRLCENCAYRAEDIEGKHCKICAENTEDNFVSKEFAEEIRNKAIDEFAEEMKWEYRESIGTSEREIHFALAVIDQVAERLKGVQE